jgi:hypothetical protein
MPPPSPSQSRHRGPDRGEWTYLTYDVDRPCAVCEQYLHSGQAVGYVEGQLLHARCYREGGESGRQPSAA